MKQNTVVNETKAEEKLATNMSAKIGIIAICIILAMFASYHVYFKYQFGFIDHEVNWNEKYSNWQMETKVWYKHDIVWSEYDFGLTSIEADSIKNVRIDAAKKQLEIVKGF